MTNLELAMTRTWAEIDLDALEGNVRSLKGLLKPGVKSLAVVKADAYGHGIVEVARKLETCGVDMLAVAYVMAAVTLRKNGIRLPILCLGQSAPSLAPLMWEYDVTQAVGDLENGLALSRAASAAGRTIKIHVKVDTGMGRIGFYWPESGWEAVADEMATLCRLPGLEAEGLFSHFANADGDPEYTRMQLAKFAAARQALADRGVTFKLGHIAASIGVLRYPEAHLDMGRFGLVLYGYASSDEDVESPAELKPVMALKARIAAVRALPKGSKIGYGGTAVLKRDSVLAVLPTGYADGYPRALSNRMSVYIHDQLCPVVGRVCMDMFMADVTDVPGVRAGDEAVLLDGRLMLKAALAGHTIIHELLSCIMPRVPRVFIEKGEKRL